ncbi:nuclear transport factor 2 family protein [Streptomyces sp. NBC_01762]|uniref:nuclear transport factor 2 family protein n=1 Tax=unclassified Streptomyces TaxID=2593676 RepID=UPI002DDB8869|nr:MULTISPECIES: nuclear transport factor 2 family protein [unclassified Streptomyces]WSC48394.1 nuclear transport factor 2 family protein [Streptomyces sp. NBC_01762]WSD28046.1 nuclear transport factor 2 family protein [Streptomyces sp. NBC_01751]
MSTSESTHVQEIQAAADALVAAFAEGRLDDYFGSFAPDATFVFHSTPQRLASTAEYRALWQQWVAEDDFRIWAAPPPDS